MLSKKGRKSFSGQTSLPYVYWKPINMYFANSEDPREMPAFEHEAGSMIQQTAFQEK